MKMRSEAGGLVVVRLDRGEPVRATLEGLARDEGIGGARVYGVGALEDPVVAYYRLAEQRYDEQRLEGIFELVSFEGNLALKDGTPMLHAHVALGGPDYALRGGHLVDAKVGVVMELFVEPLERPLRRELDEATGLPRWAP